MKKIIVLTGLLLIISLAFSQGNGQKRLMIKDQKRSKVRVFEEGQRIRVWTENELHKGRFTFLDNQYIMVGGDTVNTSDITQFKGSTNKSKIVGSVLVGTPTLVAGVTIILGYKMDDIGFLFIATGAVFAGIVSIPIGIVQIASAKKPTAKNERYKVWIEDIP